MLIHYRFLEGKRTESSPWEALGIAFQDDDGPLYFYNSEMQKPFFPPGELEDISIDLVANAATFFIIRWTEIMTKYVPPEEKDWDSAWLLVERMEWWRRQRELETQLIDPRIRAYIDQEITKLREELKYGRMASEL